MTNNENENRTEVFKNIISQLDSSSQLVVKKMLDLLIVQQNLNQMKGIDIDGTNNNK